MDAKATVKAAREFMCPQCCYRPVFVSTLADLAEAQDKRIEDWQAVLEHIFDSANHTEAIDVAREALGKTRKRV